MRQPPDSRVAQGRFEPSGAGTLPGLRDRLVAWERRAFGDPLDAYRDGVMARYLQGLRELLGDAASREQAVLLAALALGPRDHGLPGAGDLGPLVRLAADPWVDLLDAGIAWGAGWGRPLWTGHEWHARWTAAVLALASLVRGSINRTVAWLADTVTDLRDVLYAGGERELRERLEGFSDVIALELATGISARSQHRLQSWRPERCRLQAFVATAVRGSADVPVRSGAFAASMLGPLMEAEHLLRVAVAEFSVCHVCSGPAIDTAVRSRTRVRLSSLERGLYDIPRCPTCRQPAHPERTYHAARKNWMLVPADWGGQYHAMDRHRCLDCGNLFAHGRDRCPLCGWQVRRRDRPTIVWMRQAGLSQIVP